MSSPVVEYVRVLEVKGSIISGDLGDIETLGVGRSEEVVEKGWGERRRIAWVMVGWKRPPWTGEYAQRWVGRTWPSVKKVERTLAGHEVSGVRSVWEKKCRTCFESRCHSSLNSIYDSRD